MEFSSPLAAMQPPALPRAFGCGRQAAARSLAPGSFNFRDLSMKKGQGDYFSFGNGSIRGSSPTASLAADLSQNFHIDQSPQLPTPRRSLFTGGIFGGSRQYEGATTPPVRWEGITTPPIPSSSPGLASDLMDVSPLPHKVPFCLSRSSSLANSTVATPSLEEDSSSLSNSTMPSTTFTLKAPSCFERKSLLRPSLSRTKCFSTNSVAQRAIGTENQLPAFRFGAGGAGIRNSGSSSTTTLDECFMESPVQDRVVPTITFEAPHPRPTSAMGSLSRRNNSNNGGSPRHGHIKKLSDQPMRPRKLFRRSLSMFEHPGDVMKQEKKDYEPTGLQSVMDVDDTHELRLPHFIPTDTPCSLPRINQETLVQVLNGEFTHLFDQIMLIDCRFEYEYNGGHIEGAENYNDKERLAQELFEPAPSANTLLIFHCEYSQQRAPLMAQHVRKQDRTYNAANYPHLTYPEVYILDGGYSAFFTTHRARCFPQAYVGMEDAEHEHAMERGLGKMKQRKAIQRSVTFAYGQSPCQIKDLPDRYGHLGLPHSNSSIDLGFRSPARRMVSY